MNEVPSSSSFRSSLAGLSQIVRFMARRDRLTATLWIGGILGLVTVSVASLSGLYDTEQGLRDYADLATADTAMKAIAGPGHGLDNPTLGAVVMNEVLVLSFIGIPLMCIFTMVRHTRAEEEQNRTELVRSFAIGRHTILAAAVVWVSVIDLVVAVGLAACLLAFDLPVAGSMAYASASFSLGLVAIGAAAVSAQVSGSARAARAGAGLALGVAFVLRAIGDVGVGALVWISPLGWAQSIRAFANERWWVLMPLVGGAAALLLAAFGLAKRRDFGSGLLIARPGRASAPPWLDSPLRLAFRLQRTTLVSWAIALGLLGLLYGTLADEADQLLENEMIAAMFAQAGGASPSDAFLSMTVLMLALITSGFTVSSVLRLRTEEVGGRADLVLAAPIARRRWLWGHLAVSILGTATILTLAGVMVGIAYGLQIGDPAPMTTMLGAMINMGPACLVVVGATTALVGIRQEAANGAWLLIVVSAVVAVLGETLGLPGWVRNVSPFEHAAALPAASFEPVPVLVLLLIAAVLVGVGTAALERRDIG